MKQPKRQGYILVLVMVLMIGIGTELFVLSRISHSMLFETDTAHLQAQGRNMIASAMAWTRVHEQDNSGQIKLDMKQLKIPDANCSISIVKADDLGRHIQIKTLCRLRRRTFRQTENAVIKK